MNTDTTLLDGMFDADWATVQRAISRGRVTGRDIVTVEDLLTASTENKASA